MTEQKVADVRSPHLPLFSGSKQQKGLRKAAQGRGKGRTIVYPGTKSSWVPDGALGVPFVAQRVPTGALSAPCGPETNSYFVYIYI